MDHSHLTTCYPICLDDSTSYYLETLKKPNTIQPTQVQPLIRPWYAVTHKRWSHFVPIFCQTNIDVALSVSIFFVTLQDSALLIAVPSISSSYNASTNNTAWCASALAPEETSQSLRYSIPINSMGQPRHTSNRDIQSLEISWYPPRPPSVSLASSDQDPYIIRRSSWPDQVTLPWPWAIKLGHSSWLSYSPLSVRDILENFSFSWSISLDSLIWFSSLFW